jgi:hypothetical protein
MLPDVRLPTNSAISPRPSLLADTVRLPHGKALSIRISDRE